MIRNACSKCGVMPIDGRTIALLLICERPVRQRATITGTASDASAIARGPASQSGGRASQTDALCFFKAVNRKCASSHLGPFGLVFGEGKFQCIGRRMKNLQLLDATRSGEDWNRERMALFISAASSCARR
jgi:hypothetical protein